MTLLEAEHRDQVSSHLFAAASNRLEDKNTDNHFEPRVEVGNSLRRASSLMRPTSWASEISWSTAWTANCRSSHAYTIECPVCGKHFYRDKYSTKLNPHKDRYGNRCLGRTGYLT